MIETQIDNKPWQYPLGNATSWRKTPRTGVPAAPGYAAELTGVDVSMDGGQRRSPGFRLFKKLTGVMTSVTGHTVTGKQHVSGFFPVEFRVNATQYAYGFVYRVTDRLGLSKVFLEYRIGDSLTWQGPIDLVGFKTTGLQQMDVAIIGRFVYVGIKGSTPFVFYLRDTEFDADYRPTGCVASPPDPHASPATPGSPTYTLTIEENTGPGLPPDFHLASLGPDGFYQGFRSQENSEDAFTPEASPTTEDAKARIIFCGFGKPSGTPHSTVNQWDGTSGTVIAGPGALTGESDVLLWCVSPWATPAFDMVSNVYPDGVYKTTSSLSPIRTVWQPTKRNFGDPVPLPEDSYTMCFQMYDSRTGRKSPLSKPLTVVVHPEASAVSYIGGKVEGIVLRREDVVVGGSTVTHQGYFYNSYQRVNFPCIDLIYDRNRYDTLYFYRSVGYDATSVVGRGSQSLFLENVVDCIDYHTDVQPDAVGAHRWQRSVVFLTLTDKELILQEPFLGQISYETAMPSAGAMMVYEGVMLMANLGQIDPNSAQGSGVMRWSSLEEQSVELVSPLDTYTLGSGSEEILRFHKAGPNVIGLSGTNQYLVRIEAGSLKAMPLHSGYGTVGARASAGIGSFVWFLTKRGVKTVDSMGNFNDMPMLDDLILSTWKTKTQYVQMAFDATMQVLFIHNPEYGSGNTYLLDMTGSKITNLVDTGFSHVTEGKLPYDPTTAGSPMEERAVFLLEVAPTEGTYEWRTYVMDYDRTRTPGRLLDYTSSNPTGAVVSKSNVTEGSTTYVKIKLDVAVGTDFEGGRLYMLDGPLAHRSARIVRKYSGDSGQSVLLDYADAIAMFGAANPVGYRAAISPIFFRWVGCTLGMTSKDGQPFDNLTQAFTVRQANMIAASFVDVSGSLAGTDDARFAGLVYKGNTVSAESMAFPTEIDGAQVTSVIEGPSPRPATLGGATSDGPGHGVVGTFLYPGVEVVCPDLDFRLIEVQVTGSINATDRESRPLVGGTG